MLVGVSVDTVAKNAAMVEKLRLPFPLLSDPDAAVIANWDVYVTGLGPRSADSGNPADKPMPLSDLAPYFRGASFGVHAISLRTSDAAVKAECDCFRAIVGDYLKAAIATWRIAPD